MTRLLLLLALVCTIGGCLPNPQSEWTSSAGGSQRSTLEDPTILAQSTPPPGGGGFFDFDWGSAFSFSGSDDDHSSNGSPAREHAHPTVARGFGTMSGGSHTFAKSSGGGSSGGGRRH